MNEEFSNRPKDTVESRLMSIKENNNFRDSFFSILDTNPELFALLGSELRDDEAILRSVMETRPDMYIFASERLRSKPEIYFWSLNENSELLEDRDVMLAAIPPSIADNLEIQIKAVSVNGLSSLVVKDEILENSRYLVAIADKHGSDHMAACMSPRMRKEYGTADIYSPGESHLTDEQAEDLYQRLKLEV